MKTILLHLYCKCANRFRPRRVRGRKHFSGCKCGICSPSANKLCAQQTAKTCRKAPKGIFDSQAASPLGRQPVSVQCPDAFLFQQGHGNRLVPGGGALFYGLAQQGQAFLGLSGITGSSRLSWQPWPWLWLPEPSWLPPSHSRQQFRWWKWPTSQTRCEPGPRRFPERYGSP